MKKILFGLVLLSLLFSASGRVVAQRSLTDFPIYDNGGKPDLTVEPKRFLSQMAIIDRYFDPAGCEVQEGHVAAGGYRRILRFDTIVINAGDGDLVVGDRSDLNNPYADLFYFATCHGHYHIRDFSKYELLTLDGTLVVSGHKQGFCFEDSLKYNDGKSHGYNCENQGITSGWGDWYYKLLGGQWIDITGVPEGDYIVRVTINMIGSFDEGTDRYPNTIETRVHIPDPRNKVSGP